MSRSGQCKAGNERENNYKRDVYFGCWSTTVTTGEDELTSRPGRTACALNAFLEPNTQTDMS